MYSRNSPAQSRVAGEPTKSQLRDHGQVRQRHQHKPKDNKKPAHRRRPAAASSLTTSSARLSSRSPRNTGWRISPAVVHSVNFTSATNRFYPGRHGLILDAGRKGDDAILRGNSLPCSSSRVAWLKPVPTCPM
jgi:hypothetical protein